MTHQGLTIELDKTSNESERFFHFVEIDIQKSLRENFKGCIKKKLLIISNEIY